MKSQRRQNQSGKKSRQNRQRSKSQNNNRQNNSRQNNNQNRQNNQNKRVSKKSQQSQNRRQNQRQNRNLQSKKNSRTQKRLQKQRGNNRATRKNQRSQKQRKNKNKKSQRGGYGSWSLSEIQSIIPCNTETLPNGEQVSVPDWRSDADAASKICSETVDIFDAEYRAASNVPVISELQDFVPGGTTEVIAAGSSGNRLTEAQQREIGEQLVAEAEYQILGAIENRNQVQEARFIELGRDATQRWDVLVVNEYAGSSDRRFANPVVTQPSQTPSSTTSPQ